MSIKFAFLLTLEVLVATVYAEAHLKSGPYPASGWRPQKAFNLPNEKFPENILEQEPQKGTAQTADFEVNRERVDFVGQIQGNTFIPTNQPQSSYLPPSSNEGDQGEDDAFLLEQGLPGLARPRFLNEQKAFIQPQTPLQPNFRPQTQRQPQNFRPAFQTRQKNFRSQTKQPQNFQPAFQTKQTNFRSRQAQEQNFIPQGNQQRGTGFISSSQSSEGVSPAQQYGAPGISSGQINIIYPDPRKQETSDEPNYTAIEALNAAVDAYNRAQAKRIRNESTQTNDDEGEESATDNDYTTTTTATTDYPYKRTPARFQRGQYYIIGSDNELQRVMFTTSQDDQEAKTNSFTAQLKYSPAGEIRDPLFKYNESGQLVRLLKK